MLISRHARRLGNAVLVVWSLRVPQMYFQKDIWVETKKPKECWCESAVLVTDTKTMWRSGVIWVHNPENQTRKNLTLVRSHQETAWSGGWSQHLTRLLLVQCMTLRQEKKVIPICAAQRHMPQSQRQSQKPSRARGRASSLERCVALIQGAHLCHDLRWSAWLICVQTHSTTYSEVRDSSVCWRGVRCYLGHIFVIAFLPMVITTSSVMSELAASQMLDSSKLNSLMMLLVMTAGMNAKQKIWLL